MTIIATTVGILTSSLVATPAWAGTQVVSGRVTCINSGVVGVWVVGQSSTSGWATLRTDISIQGFSSALYSYQLNRGGAYQVVVGCGGTSARWGQSLRSAWVGAGKNNFMCNNLNWFQVLLGKAVLRKIFGYGPDLSEGVPQGTCKHV